VALDVAVVKAIGGGDMEAYLKAKFYLTNGARRGRLWLQLHVHHGHDYFYFLFFFWLTRHLFKATIY
jgi:hypothetical protein